MRTTVIVIAPPPFDEITRSPVAVPNKQASGLAVRLLR